MGGRLGEILLILGIVLLIFGTGKLRNVGTDLGSAIRDFRKSMGAGEKKEASEKKELEHDATADKKPSDTPPHNG